MTTQDPLRLAIALVALVALTVVVAVVARLPLRRPALVAALRATIQLALVSLVIAAVVRNLAWSALFAVAMLAIGVLTSAGRCQVRRRWQWVAVAMLSGVVPVLAIIFVSGASPLNGAALIPVAGIIIGNTMTGHTLVARRAFTSLRQGIGSYEAALAIGLPRPQAMAQVTEQSRVESLVPGIDSTRTVGLVTLPGAFVGVMLGGGSPVQAGATQLLVLFGILAAQFITVSVADVLIRHAKLLPDDLAAVLRE